MRPGRLGIINLLGLLILIIIAGIVYYLWHQSYYCYSTDDAVVSGMTANVADRMGAWPVSSRARGLVTGSLVRIRPSRGS